MTILNDKNNILFIKQQNVSLYLKYRPSDFSSLYGQNFTKQTLQKAIAEDKTVGAYLFCGPRGTGKTSSARIFAKAINCLDPQEWNPCGKCKVCVDFSDERLVDIIEIDAASHTWVDNIREIIERAQFAPNFCKYKIYIIDEVHMLSKWAFNALLKILEEPPKHVKFILATTETHKVPDTIISRCQRYDFKRISSEDITARLQFISESEWVTIDEKSLDYIVKNSWGGLRNAISLFEQLIVDNQIKYETVIETLWIVEEDILDNFLQKLLQKDVSVINDFDSLVESWKNLKVFFKELIFFTKQKAIWELKFNNPIVHHIEVLDALDTTYWKTKNSLDENTTFLIWILKIISQYQEVVNTQNSQISVKSTWNNKKLSVENNLVTEKKIESQQKPTLENKVEEVVTHNDAFDIFWDWETEDKKVSTQSENIVSSHVSNTQFSTQDFIQKLKNKWAKWALTMALRWSWLELIWNTLIIRTKTKIASWQVTNVDNLALMSQILTDMWIENPEIKPN